MKTFTAAILALTLSGCAGLRENWTSSPQSQRQEAVDQLRADLANVQITKFSEPYPQTIPKDITLMTGVPSARYVELAMLTVQMDQSDDNYFGNLLRFRAAELGADAIVKYELAQVATGTKQTSIIRSTKVNLRYEKRATGVAVKFLK